MKDNSVAESEKTLAKQKSYSDIEEILAVLDQQLAAVQRARRQNRSLRDALMNSDAPNPQN